MSDPKQLITVHKERVSVRARDVCAICGKIIVPAVERILHVSTRRQCHRHCEMTGADHMTHKETEAIRIKEGL